MNQSILITGGIGYIGSITTVELYKIFKDQYKIIIIDNLSNSSLETKNILANLVPFSFYQIDIRDKQALKQLFEEAKQQGNPITYIIHFAGLKAVGESVEEPLKYYDNNVNGTLKLLDVAQSYNCLNFIFSSSATIYPPGEYINEESEFSPSNPYGETKVMIEYMIRSLSKKGGRFISLRYFNPVGATKDGLLGEIPENPKNLVPFIDQVVIGKREKLFVFGNDYPTTDGTGVRDYIHILDLAGGHISVLQRMIQKNENQENWYDYFNLGTGKGYSVMEIISTYEKISGQSIKYEIIKRREGDIAISVANPNKAKIELGWVAKLGLEEMCQDSYNYIIQKQQKNN